MNPPIPFLSFRAAICDWPWDYEVYSAKGKGKSPDYPTLHVDAAPRLREELQLDFIFAPDAVMIFWGTWAMLARGDLHKLVQRFGFAPVTGGAWFKITKRGKDTIGTGHYFRDNCEPYILGIRGNPGQPKVRNIRNGFRAVRSQVHSEKPLYLHRALERMYPRGPYLELFGREPQKGWNGWGNQYGAKPIKRERKIKLKPGEREPEPPPDPDSLLAKMKQQVVPIESA